VRRYRLDFYQLSNRKKKEEEEEEEEEVVEEEEEEEEEETHLLSLADFAIDRQMTSRAHAGSDSVHNARIHACQCRHRDRETESRRSARSATQRMHSRGPGLA
jgi:hypothetical protein